MNETQIVLFIIKFMIDKWLSDSKLKKKYEKFIQKSLRKISPNRITIYGLIVGLLSALTIWLSGIFLDLNFILIVVSIILMIFSFFLDSLDGPIARIKGKTIFGGILDIFCDRTVEIFIIIAIVSTDLKNLIYPGLFSLAAIVLCISMFLLVGAKFNSEEADERKKVIYYRGSLMERSETLLFLLVITMLYLWRFLFLWIFAILVFITAFLRLRDAYLLFKEK